MRILLETRIIILYLVKFGWKGTEIIPTLQNVYGNHALKKTYIYKWIERFRVGKDYEGGKRP